MKYTILPLDTKDQDVLRDHKLFESWDILDKTSGFNISQYKKVYEGEVEDQGGDLKTLDHLFGVFNIHHPKDFRGYSLSVSDVVRLDGTDYYCYSLGWVNIKEVKKNQQMKSNKELLDAIYAHFPNSGDKDETMCDLITDSLASICYWNMENPEPRDKTKTYYEDRIWEDIKSGRDIEYGDPDNMGTLNLTNILKSLDTIKRHDPDTYEAIRNEEWDAESCDVFFQTAVFGEVVFG